MQKRPALRSKNLRIFEEKNLGYFERNCWKKTKQKKEKYTFPKCLLADEKIYYKYTIARALYKYYGEYRSETCLSYT